MVGSESKARAQSIARLLDTPLVASLLLTHPNDLCSSPIPASWHSWWSWAASTSSFSAQPHWKDLVQYYTRRADSDSDDNLNLNYESPQQQLPDTLRTLLDDIRRLQLPRNLLSLAHPIPTTLDRPSLAGMSPKKEHEVVRMAAYIAQLRAANPHLLGHVRHVVDVGAGQAHLSRVLSTHLGFHVLALDSNDIQTRGAQRWDSKAKRRQQRQQQQRRGAAAAGSPSDTSSLTHKTIRITTETLHAAIDEWIRGDNNSGMTTAAQPVPVLLVALHACGSLTPDILRYFVTRNRPTTSTTTRHPIETTWVPVGLVTVGCCYNLMSPHDFPLSTFQLSPPSPCPSLPLSALHLATQIPAHWLTTPSTSAAASLAIRKVVWRALLQRFLIRNNNNPSQRSVTTNPPDDANNNVDGTGQNTLNTRLGRLPDSVYMTCWKTFLRAAATRLHLDTGGPQDLETGSQQQQQEGNRWETVVDPPSRVDQGPLEVLHVLRCLLGPLVESLIVLDRLLWLREALNDDSPGTRFDVNLVNLFDQATGSGRNIAIVVVPRA